MTELSVIYTHRCLNYRRVYQRLQTFLTYFISTFITRHEINQASCEAVRRMRYDVKNATGTARTAAELSVNIGVEQDLGVRL